jgi:D-tyrosyl-tRNA(Tyr) deacylase
MRAVVQRVKQASVSISGEIVASIVGGLLIFAGIEDADEQEDIEWLSNKVVNLRIFDDQDSVPNLSVKESEGEILLVSQFTLHATVKKGNRPSYIKAAKPEVALPIYEKLILELETVLGKGIQTGTFGADMKVSLVNDGPLTVWIDTKNKE